MILRALLFSLLLLSPALAQERSLPEIELDLRAGPLEVEALLERSARSLGALAVISSGVRGATISIAHPWSGSLPWPALERVLDWHEIQARVTPGSQQSPPLLRAWRSRGVGSSDPRFVPGPTKSRAPRVTAILEIQCGAASAIYANMRGIISGRYRRHPDFLYIQGPELIVVSGSAAEVRHYRALAESLDLPGPRRLLRTFPVSAEADAEAMAQALQSALLEPREPVRDLLFRRGLAPRAWAFEGRICVTGSREEVALAERLLRALDPSPAGD